MRLKLVVLGFCVIFCSSVFAINRHIHPQANNKELAPIEKKFDWPGYCEIEIINRSYEDVRVYGVFDDGYPMEPFTIYSFEGPHYISLYVYGYCHAGMDLYIDTWSGYHLYAGYTPRRRSIRIVPYLSNQLKAEISDA